MHLACSTISSGIALSGASMTSCKTSAAFFRRSSTFVLAALAHKGPARASIATSGISFFIFFIIAPKLTHNWGGSVLRPNRRFNSLNLNRNPVFHRGDSRRQPRHPFRLFLLNPRADGSLQNGLAALDLNRDLVGIDLGVAHQRILDPLFQF